MPQFLKVVRFQEALSLLLDRAPAHMEELVSLEESHRRVLAQDIYSPEDMPAFNRSTVDGYVVRAEDTFGSSESLPGMVRCVGKVEMGLDPGFSITAGECAWMPTGGMLPEGSDAVVMVEYTEKLGTDTILVSRPVAPGENVMHKGEDVSRGALVFKQGERLAAKDIGLLASLGINAVGVAKPYKVGIMSTGDEIIPVDQCPALGQVRDVNSYSLAAAVQSCGAMANRYPLVKDDIGSLQQALRRAWEENDIVLVSGGSSVGVSDYSVEVMLSLPAAEMLFHGIAVKPGKPSIGVAAGRKLIIGLPGHPVSALMVFYLLCAPVINPVRLASVQAEMVVNVASQPGRDDFVPVRLVREGESWQAQPVLGKSGLMRILAQADGFVRIAYEQQGIYAGDRVDVAIF
ncbi:MAG: molybdopterin-binding protein [Syntrophomonas sp.]|nr:molybdopterin-binding protein [Syntrophomonas sp.]